VRYWERVADRRNADGSTPRENASVLVTAVRPRQKRWIAVPGVKTGFGGVMVWLGTAFTLNEVTDHFHLEWWQDATIAVAAAEVAETVYALLLALAAWFAVDVE
jgi:hypothetical protein